MQSGSMRETIGQVIRGWLRFVVAPVAFLVVGLGVGAAFFGDSDSAGGRSATRLDHAIISGDVQQMLDRHQVMMVRMRVDATPAMLALMDADPMWQQMRTGEFAKLMEEHQAQIDRMLGNTTG